MREFLKNFSIERGMENIQCPHSADEKYEAKQGFCITISSDNLTIVKSWSNEYQTFIPLKEEEEKNFKIGINNLDFDKNLGD